MIWHWFIKYLVGTWRRNDVDATSLRRIDDVTTSCACWDLAPPLPPPPPPPPNILNLPTPMGHTHTHTFKQNKKQGWIAVLKPAMLEIEQILR